MEVWVLVRKAAEYFGLPAFIVAVISIWYSHRLQIANERLKSDLQRSLKEHEVRFSALHARRVGVLAKLYRRLLYAHSAYLSLTSKLVEGEPPKEEKERLFWRKWQSFKDYFNLNRLWLDGDLCQEIDGYVSAVSAGTDDYSEWQYYVNLAPHLADMPGVRENLVKAHKRIQQSRKPLASLLDQLIARFRDLLGAGDRAQV